MPPTTDDFLRSDGAGGLRVQPLTGKNDIERREPARFRFSRRPLRRIAAGNSMPEPLLKTFELLAESQATGAIDLLISALDSKYAAIHERAVVSLLRRGTTRCQT